MAISGGTMANLNGAGFEKHVITHLKHKGLTKISTKLMNNTSKSILNTKFPNGVYAKGHNKYTSIYANPRCHSKYLVYINEKIHFRLECKWQQYSGSTHEKIPYFYLNLIEGKFPEPLTVFVYGGEKMNEPAKWLKTAWKDRLYVKKGFNKELKILTLDEFMSWSNKEF
tara:strand:- start:56 stop:562 length:507 start_codon:yes stop_codon:yes gene_type:complete